MNWFDIVLIAILAVAAFMGMRTGLIGAAITAIGGIIGWLIAGRLSDKVGGLFGDSPTFERYYAGGIGSVRGFEFRGISPRQGLFDDAVGGDFRLLAKAEYSFPLYGDNLRGVFFTDMGTVEEGFELTSWRMSIGFGVRLQINFFGPVPLEFDLAVPILKDIDDEEQVFSFFIGATF